MLNVRLFRVCSGLLAFVLLAGGMLGAPGAVRAQTSATEVTPISPYTIIDWVNQGRAASGLHGLLVDSILMRTAQTTAEIMAASMMQGHIGDVRGRVAAAGYGNGDVVWATENYIVLSPGTEDGIMAAWSDPEHMRPVEGANYTHIGVGAAVTADGSIYYVLHAAYTEMGRNVPKGTVLPAAQTSAAIYYSRRTTTTTPAAVSMSDWVFAVQTVTPQPDGRLVHVVRPGQSLWSIAIAYDTHIVDLVRINNLSPDNPTIYTGQRLVVPTSTGARFPSPTVSLTAAAAENRPAQTASPGPPPGVTPLPTLATPAPTGDPLDRVIPWVIGGFFALGLLLVLGGSFLRRR